MGQVEMNGMKALAKDKLLAFIVSSICVLGGNNLLLANPNPAQDAKRTPATTPVSQASPANVAQPSGAAKSTKVGAPSRYSADPLPPRAERYYKLFWGVDSLKVKSAESGELVRFSYRVVDPDKAKALNDKANEPSLVDPAAGVKLSIPSLEKVGKLRQSSSAEAGKIYWMAFSNKGRHVKPGDRVNVVIGNFQANRLIVE
jgi:hypothetical protein